MSDDGLTIVSVDVKDVRFPTSLELHGSDAMVNSTFYNFFRLEIN